MITEGLKCIRDIAQGAIEFVVEAPLRTLVITLIGTGIFISGWDVWEGEWISHSGTVVGRYWNTSEDCDDDGCTTETNYYVTVAHQGVTDNVGVTLWNYYRYTEGTKVQINYRKGGVFGVHWFTTVSDPKPDF